MASEAWKNWKAARAAEALSQGEQALKHARAYSQETALTEALRGQWGKVANAMEVLLASEE